MEQINGGRGERRASGAESEEIEGELGPKNRHAWSEAVRQMLGGEIDRTRAGH